MRDDKSVIDEIVAREMNGGNLSGFACEGVEVGKGLRVLNESTNKRRGRESTVDFLVSRRQIVLFASYTEIYE